MAAETVSGGLERMSFARPMLATSRPRAWYNAARFSTARRVPVLQPRTRQLVLTDGTDQALCMVHVSTSRRVPRGPCARWPGAPADHAPYPGCHTRAQCAAPHRSYASSVPHNASPIRTACPIRELSIAYWMAHPPAQNRTSHDAM
eukprot:3864862-Rhodomonas_salina.2